MGHLRYAYAGAITAGQATFGRQRQSTDVATTRIVTIRRQPQFPPTWPQPARPWPEASTEQMICIQGSVEAYRVNRHSYSALGARLGNQTPHAQ